MDAEDSYPIVKTLKETEYLWSTTIVTLVLNVLVTIGAFFIRNELAKKLIFPFLFSYFFLHDEHNDRNALSTRLIYCTNMIICLTIVVFTILDFVIPNKKKQVVNLSDQEDNGNEKNDQQSIKISLILWILILWLYQIISGISAFNGMKDSGYMGYITEYFSNIFSFITFQFVCSMYILYNNQPVWLYFVGMIILAILYPLSGIIAYYHRSNKIDDISKCYTCANALLTGSFIYLAYISVFDLISQFKKGSNTQLKHLQCLVFLGLILWITFVDGVYDMGNKARYIYS